MGLPIYADGRRLQWQCSCRQNGGVQVQAVKPGRLDSETIEWMDVEGDGLPDEGLTVLIETPSESEPIWLGFLSEGHWHYVDGCRVDTPVLGWAELPVGRRALGQLPANS